MNELSSSSSEKHVEDMLELIGSEGLLDSQLSDIDLEQFLNIVPHVLLSDHFIQRATSAMREAQDQRTKRNPAIALGNLLSLSRLQAGLAIKEISMDIGVASHLLEALEFGLFSARNILRTFPPDLIVRLLMKINLSISIFTNHLIRLSESGGYFPNSLTTSKLSNRLSETDPNLPVDIMKYVERIEQISKTSR